jgi:hypothetical protein
VFISLAVNVLVTGRPEEDVVDWFNINSSDVTINISPIVISEAATNRDIKTYVKGRLQKSRKLSNSSIVGEVEAAIMARVNGMFLYVRLMLNELEGESTVASVRRRMGEFPGSLSTYYKGILARMSRAAESTQELARNILMWTVTAMEPRRSRRLWLPFEHKPMQKLNLRLDLTLQP